MAPELRASRTHQPRNEIVTVLDYRSAFAFVVQCSLRCACINKARGVAMLAIGSASCALKGRLTASALMLLRVLYCCTARLSCRSARLFTHRHYVIVCRTRHNQYSKPLLVPKLLCGCQDTHGIVSCDHHAQDSCHTSLPIWWPRHLTSVCAGVADSDVDTKAMRASAPLVPVWDDHEYTK